MKDTFCNTPWYEAHIYWDGSLGICCQESRKLYKTTETQYNIKKMSLMEWFNSPPAREFRLSMFSPAGTDVCSRCYSEQFLCGTSRRHRSNQKSVIFTKQAFDSSLKQSPGYPQFVYSKENNGFTNTMPIDLHIDLGNHCNLACKMCWPGASTKIASQYVKWGLVENKQYLGTDWTSDSEVWKRFLNELACIDKLKNIHLMGGETLLSPRFEQLVDFMIEHKRFDVSFSFVTNGTVYRPELINKLKKFARVGIEISIETVTLHNNYVRQGSDVNEVIENILKYKTMCADSTASVTIRPAISLLTIGYYYTLLQFCLDNNLLIKSLVVSDPAYLKCSNLPNTIKEKYAGPYLELLNKLSEVDVSAEYNESEINNVDRSIKMQVIQSLKLLETTTADIHNSLVETVDWCKKWDTEYGFNAKELYPELEEVFTKYGY